MEIESLPIMTTPASLQSPQDYSEVDQPEATRTPIGSELDQQNNFTSTHRTETTSKPEITTQQENKLLKNVTTQPNSSVSGKCKACSLTCVFLEPTRSIKN